MAANPSARSVAEAAGVSPSTVSNAYNRPERLSTAVRNRVFAVAAEQGYIPDAAARSLRTGRTGTIGVIVTVGLSYAFSDPYYIELLGGLAEITEETRTGLTLLPVRTPPPDASDDEIRAAVQAVERAVIDGAVADDVDRDHPAARVLSRRGIPIVRSSYSDSDKCAVVDDRDAGRTVGRHLAELGHRDTAVIVSDPERYPYSRLRLAGIRSGLGSGARVRVATTGHNSAEAARGAAARILDGGTPTAIAADSDVLALAVLEELRGRGLRAGRDVAVTGFDDIPAAAAAGLTTIRQPTRDKGRTMGRMLLDPEFTTRRVVLPTRLVIRSSTEPSIEQKE